MGIHLRFTLRSQLRAFFRQHNRMKPKILADLIQVRKILCQISPITWAYRLNPQFNEFFELNIFRYTIILFIKSTSVSAAFHF